MIEEVGASVCKRSDFFVVVFVFLQAEDGIRDSPVTGVQTCALPICSPEQADTDGDSVMDATDACADTPAGELANSVGCSLTQLDSDGDGVNDAQDAFPEDPNEVSDSDGRSEERRVGKECRSRWSP